MSKPKTVSPRLPARRQPNWLMGGIALLTLLAVALLDYVTGKDYSLTLLYLAPIAIAVAFVGPLAGLVMCVLAAGVGVLIAFYDQVPVSVAVWNAAIRFGVYLVFYSLLDLVVEARASEAMIARARRYIVAGVGIGIVLFLVALVIQHEAPANASLYSTSGSASIGKLPLQSPLAEMGSLLQASLKASRPLLLGSRDPNGASCVEISHTGDIHGVLPENKGDLDGGPGTSMAVLFFFDRQGVKSAQEEYKWQQTRLRTFLENNIVLNPGAEKLAHDSAEKARALMDAVNSWSAIPVNFTATGFSHTEDWPGYCLAAVDKAVKENNLPEAKRWATELAAATFWLEDLLRWRGFLFKNHLAALDFQARCETLFAAADMTLKNYIPQATFSQFPAGVLGLNSIGNYYEVERQAERIFSMPSDRLNELTDDKNLTPASMWMAPASRGTFLQLRAALSASNQETWDLAAQTPYEHSYLVNILFRARTGDLVDNLAAVLKKFDARNPHARIGELMSVLMYRGHSFAGLEWGDRFQPELKQAADEIPDSDSDLDALQKAWAWTSRFYKAPAEYGVTFTLRDALAEKKLDCVRATDMIAAIFRNAGRTRLGHVRWCSESGGHSVNAFFRSANDQSKPVLADGLTAPHEPEAWPDCYFHDHPWPPGFETNRAPYAMELYVRGIDSYVWAQGYIARGPNAGSLTTAGIPYSTRFPADKTEKVFDGPYPE